MRSKRLVKFIAMMLVGGLFCSVPVIAAEKEDTPFVIESELLSEDETFSSGSASKSFSYGLARGNYLMYGRSEVGNEGGGIIGVYGSTVANTYVTTISLKLYLERKTETSGWTQIASWSFSDSNASIVAEYVDKTATTGTYYYRVCGTHTIKMNNVTETLSSATDGIKITK